MKLKSIAAVLLSLAPFFTCSAHSPDGNDKIPYTLHAEHDKTDIFAIPVDSSEAEENEELEGLEETQEEEQAKKK